MTPVDQILKEQLALAFADFVSAGDYLAAAHIVMRAATAFETQFIADLLETAAHSSISVSQKIGTVEAGSSVVGYSARRIGG